MTMNREAIEGSEEFALVHLSEGVALVHNKDTDRLEVYQHSPGYAGWALTIGGEDYEFCREETQFGLGGGFGEKLRLFANTGDKEHLISAWYAADLRNRAILAYIEPRLPQWADAYGAGTLEAMEGVRVLFGV
jgi:hypothetical protein